MVTETETIYPCVLKLDTNCPVDCPTYPQIKAVFDRTASENGITVSELVILLRAQEDLAKTMFSVLFHGSMVDNPQNCTNFYKSRILTLIRPHKSK